MKIEEFKYLLEPFRNVLEEDPAHKGPSTTPFLHIAFPSLLEYGTRSFSIIYCPDKHELVVFTLVPVTFS